VVEEGSDRLKGVQGINNQTLFLRGLAKCVSVGEPARKAGGHERLPGRGGYPQALCSMAAGVSKVTIWESLCQVRCSLTVGSFPLRSNSLSDWHNAAAIPANLGHQFVTLLD